MDIKGLSMQGNWSYVTDDFGGTDWEMTGTGVNVDLNADFDAAGMFWSKFRLFYNAGSGTVKDEGIRLAGIDSWDIGFGLLAGVRVFNQDENSISVGAGFGMSFGMMSVGTTPAGDERWDAGCPDFNGIIEDPAGITCYLDSLDGSYTSKKFLAEAAFDFGPITLTPSFEWSINSQKKGQVMAPNLYRFGIGAGVDF